MIPMDDLFLRSSMTLLFRVYLFNAGVVLSLNPSIRYNNCHRCKVFSKKALMYCAKFAMKKHLR